MEEKMKEKPKSKPLVNFRNGKVNVAVWKQEGKDESTFYTMSAEKRYKDKNDEWQSTNSYTIEDCNNLLWCVGMARDYIYRQKVESNLD